MRKRCKNVIIIDRNFLRQAILKCLKSKLGRMDTLRMFAEYCDVPINLLKKIAHDKKWHFFIGIIETVVDGVRQEILSGTFVWKPIWYTKKVENGKERRVGIQDVKQQLYDYIAVSGLSELLKMIGYYQCAALPGKGQLMGARSIYRCLRNKNIRYAWKGDAKHYYENINTLRLKSLLKKYVKNDILLEIVNALIDSFESGLSIGSYLSQYLANWYMSFAYHFATEKLIKARNKRNGESVKVPLISRAYFYMDDILILAKNLKYLKLAVKRLKEFMQSQLDIVIKPDDQWIDLSHGYIDMMGFVVSRTKMIVRPRIFRRYRRSILEVRRSGKITTKRARSIISRYGWMSNAQTRRWQKRNKGFVVVNKCKEVLKNARVSV